MEKIGYIYKYNPSEGMGILVFGVWKEKGYWGPPVIKSTPILFSTNDLLSDVSTGQLVYFDTEGKNASNIERASLSNFKVEFINSIIRCKDGESEYSFYSNNTIISFECLDNIIIPNEDKQSNSSNTINEATNILPDSIIDLFNCFGKYKHKGRKETTLLNVIDLSLWIDSDVLSTEYYGIKVDELLFLYDLFVLKKRYNRKGNEIYVKIDNDCISPKWSLLLSKFSDEELKEIIYKAPKLQPALPVDFCKKNIGILTNDYGMPNVEICELYWLHKISNAEYISDYKYIKHKLYEYSNCNATHLDDEGTPMCKMGKTRIRNLEKLLEEQYQNVIKQKVIAQLMKFCENASIVDDLNNSSVDDFERIAIFIENYNNLRSNFLEFEVCYKVIDSYEELPKEYQDALKASLLNFVNESAISATQLDDVTPFKLSCYEDIFYNWILESTKQQIKVLVSDRFSKLDDLEELSEAYKANYISIQQYCSRYEQITSNSNASQFLNALCDCNFYEYPIEIQWYVVSNIINQLGYESLDSYKYVQVNFDSICNIRGLLKWLANYGHLKDIVYKKAEEKICSVLSKNERWTLFEEKIVQSPGIENIRERLNNMYKKYDKNSPFYFLTVFPHDISDREKEILKHDCFQDVMLSDIDSIMDPKLMFFIADNLDPAHQYLLQQKATGILNLYLWQKQPSNSYNWELIKSHYHELPAEAQIKILRYIFGKMSSGEFSLSLEDLYTEFVETNTPACSAICGILYILKTKKNDLNVSITTSMIESIIGEEQEKRINFLKESGELFYPCHGYLAMSGTKFDIEYQSFNGILTKENKNNELYYVVKFYESPVNLYGRTIEWLDSEDVKLAEQVLLRNSSVEVIDGKYYIHESHEFFIKQFVIAYDIDDKCGLVSDKERMIELGWLPRNNAYRPLYTNNLKKYEESDNYICRGGSFGSSDSLHYGIPFFWCKKKMCVRRAHFLLPPSKWEDYRFADLLFIVLGQSPDARESVWRVNGEISQFICDYMQVVKSNERNICSKPLNELEERGIWDEKSSVYRDIYDGDDDE